MSGDSPTCLSLWRRRYYTILYAYCMAVYVMLIGHIIIIRADRPKYI